MLERPVDQRVAVAPSLGEDDLPGLAKLQGQRRVEDVRRGETVVNPAAFVSDRVGDDVDERGHVVPGRALALVHRLNGERGAFPADLRSLGRNRSLGCPGLERGELDLEPELHPALGAPDRAHLSSRVAADHRDARNMGARALTDPSRS